MAISLSEYKQLRAQGLSPTDIAQQSKGKRGVAGLATGAGKGGLSTLAGLQSVGQQVLGAVGRTLAPKKFERKLGFDQPTIEAESGIPALKDQRVFQPIGTAEKIGFGVEQIAEFILPSSKIAKVEKGLPLAKRAVVEAGAFGGITTAQKGEFGEDAITASIIGAAFPVVGTALKGVRSVVGGGKARRAIGEKIQTTVIKPTQKDIKDGFKIENVTKHNVGGNLQDTVAKAHVRMNVLGNELRQKLKGNSASVNLNDLAARTEESLLGGGKPGQFGDVAAIRRVLQQLQKEINEQAGENGMVNLVQANFIKRGAGTKGAWAFGRPEPDASAVETVYTTFYNQIKKEIEKTAPDGVREINKSMSELIPISNAALRRLPVEQRNNVISLTDSVGLFASMFDPKALGMIGLKRLFQSGTFGNFLSQSGARAAEQAPKVPSTAIGKRLFGN